MSKTITAVDLHRIFSIHSVNPSDELTAAAGADYGYVAAWELGDDAGYLIQYGNNGQTDYQVAEDADDLAAWLESPDLDPLDGIVQTANVRGAEEIDAATADDTGPFYILRTRYWYGPTESSDIERVGDRLAPVEFKSHQAAQDWIADTETECYCLSHNESGAPSYKIVAV